MSGSGRTRVSKWDSKEEDTKNGNDYVQKSGSYYHNKDPDHAGFYQECNGSRGSVPDDDDDDNHLKCRQNPGEAWPSRSRVSHEEDESRQPYWDRTRTHRSGSGSNSRSLSRSRSRSPFQRVRRGSYDRHKMTALSGRYIDGSRYHDWEAKERKTRDSKYCTEDSREQYHPLRGGERSDYSSEEHNNSRRETKRRDVPEREYNRISSVPCRYFALGNCRNGTSCRFSHHGARRSPERKPQDQMFSRHRWNERSDTGKSSEEAKGNNNNGSWIGDMEMSPEWNYGVKTLKNIENHSAVSSGGSQVLLPPAVVTTHLSSGLNSNNHENGTVSREELNHISKISASLAQFFGNGQLHSTLNAKQAIQVPEEEQSSHAQSDLLSNNSIQTGLVPNVTALQTNNRDSLVSLAGNPKASSEENSDKKIDKEGSKEPDGRKTEQEEKEAVGEEEEEGEDDENIKKEKEDPKGMKAFKFALVEIVKELLKPAWKEGGMNKDAYKNIVKKAVDKVTGAIQTGNIPQTQEKIDHYLSASKPKLTKLVQAYISKVKKS